jgi:murein DD-endopeptidase MepM/ murein hydrolase activator NlpD
LIPVYPLLSVRIFQWREPFFQIPLSIEAPIQIREDPYGSGEFGARRSGGHPHRGIDLAAPIGTEVLASKSGIASIGQLKNGMGRYVEIRHPDGWMTLYGHLKRIEIGHRQKVQRGDRIGTVGKSGNARRLLIQSHMHFEVWNALGEPVDPLPLLEQDKDASS